MRIVDLLQNQKSGISFEFFPPKTQEAEDDLFVNLKSLESYNPVYVSVTYGAGGSTRDKTKDIVIRMTKQEHLTVMAHLTCVNQKKQEVDLLLNDYKKAEIHNILALRGDLPKGMEMQEGDFLHAIDLIKYIRNEYSNYFSIGGAAFPELHPESKNYEFEMVHFKEKVEAGMDFAVTQMFFDNKYYFDYIDQCIKYGINIPVIPGIMPITNFKQIQKFAELSAAKIPQSLLAKIDKYNDDPESVMKIGIDYATNQCEELIKNGVHFLHLFTLNKSQATANIYDNIKHLLFKE